MKYNAFFIPMILMFLLLGSTSCDKNKTFDDTTENIVTGTSSYAYNSYAPFANKPIDCFYHIPENSTAETPVLIVLPGAGRDAAALRNDLIESANTLGYIVLALRFDEVHFPGSDAYNLANIYVDGDNPSEATLNPQEEWTFSVIDPLFENFKSLVGNSTANYDIFGHSAGSQLLHRFLIFQPENLANRFVLSAAGWYCMPDPTVDFPYGTKISPAQNTSMVPVFATETYVMVGQDDTDPNSFNLRHTPEADLQGNHRLERAQYFYSESYDLAAAQQAPFNWKYNMVPNTGHDGSTIAQFAADKLYGN